MSYRLARRPLYRPVSHTGADPSRQTVGPRVLRLPLPETAAERGAVRRFGPVRHTGEPVSPSLVTVSPRVLRLPLPTRAARRGVVGRSGPGFHTGESFAGSVLIVASPRHSRALQRATGTATDRSR